MNENLMSIEEIMRYLPHRYPFLLIDRVLECEPGKQVSALKNVTINEPFFEGHFPLDPVMPGALIIETMAQAMGILAYKTIQATPEHKPNFYLVGVDKARFKHKVVPGDQLLIKVSLKKRKHPLWVFHGECLVDDRLVASAEIMCAEQAV